MQLAARLMGKITQGFVIAACSVVIAGGGLWLFGQYNASQNLERCADAMIAAGIVAKTQADRAQIKSNCAAGVYGRQSF
jgi:hypothetical protein